MFVWEAGAEDGGLVRAFLPSLPPLSSLPQQELKLAQGPLTFQLSLFSAVVFVLMLLMQVLNYRQLEKRILDRILSPRIYDSQIRPKVAQLSASFQPEPLWDLNFQFYKPVMPNIKIYDLGSSTLFKFYKDLNFFYLI